MDRKKVEGINELNALLSNIKNRAIILFTSSKEDGKSWCPDCVKAEPVIEEVIKDVISCGGTDSLTFIECAVGQRT
uniref:Thioredoxin domain-containing protein 17 n=1 Tax=Setaria digitata TaxID=48799 RepID=A0A915PWK4_9BILA